MKKIVRGIFLTAIIFSLIACHKGDVQESEYTYHEAIGGTPAEWNPHIMTSSNATFINSMTTIGWVQMGMKENKDYQWTYEMAESITDITSTFDQKAKYGIGESEENRVYEIKLNENACWEEGTPINADTYIYSMQQLLNYDLKNPASTNFTDGAASIYKAKEYLYNGKNAYTFIGMEGVVSENSEGNGYICNELPVYYSLTEVNPIFGMSLEQYYQQYPETFMDESTNLYNLLNVNVNSDGYTLLTSALLPHLKKVAANMGNESFWVVLCSTQGQYEAEWSDVGFFKKDDYTLVFITKMSTKLEDLYTRFSEGFLVYQPLYEAGKTTQGSLLTTNYGTSVDTYKSYGPYKLQSIERNKQIVLVKNDKWYGYSDGQHNGQYQTTKIYGQVLTTHETILNTFLKGELEKVELTNNDMTKYRYSDYLLKAEESFIFSLSLNSNLEQLQALETLAGDGSNKRVGAYKTFKEALSYAINRLNFVTEGTAGSKVQYGLFNSQYYYDGEHIYRTSEAGMKVIVNHYGISYGDGADYSTLADAYNSITGYDLSKAKTLFQQTYLQMKNDGNYTDGQLIKLNCLASEHQTLSEEKISQQNLINRYISEATAGTGFEGKISVTFTRSNNNNKDFHDGNYEMILSQKSGSELSPYMQIRKYIVDGDITVPEVACFDPRSETMTLTINGEEKTKTIRQWANTLNNGGDYYNASHDIKLLILSSLEQYLLDQFIDIPLYTRCLVSLNSKKINQGSNEYNLFYGFGGLRYITYNYTDKQWSDYVKRNSGTLKYE